MLIRHWIESATMVHVVTFTIAPIYEGYEGYERYEGYEGYEGYERYE